MNEDFVLPAIASPSSYMRKGLFDDELAKHEEEDLLSDVDSQPDAPEHAGDEEQEYFLLRYDPIGLYLASPNSIDANDIGYLYDLYDNDKDFAITPREIITNMIKGGKKEKMPMGLKRKMVLRDDLSEERVNEIIEKVEKKFGAYLNKEQFKGAIRGILADMCVQLLQDKHTGKVSPLSPRSSTPAKVAPAPSASTATRAPVPVTTTPVQPAVEKSAEEQAEDEDNGVEEVPITSPK